MASMPTKPSKGQVRRAIEGSLKDNAKLYELLAQYDEKNHAKLKRKTVKTKHR
ncbi:MAG: hypothetical protein HMLIMOIP_000951 [Candidatus Nitrosomirales archaeon]|jgi:hypothetical protein